MVQRKRIIFKTEVIAVAVLALVISWSLTGWGQSRSKNPWEFWDYGTKPVRGGVLRTCWAVDVGVMNPNHYPVNNWYVIETIYEKLLFTDGSYRPVPWLAESWTFPNELTCVMKLRKGVRFHDGTPFNAEAVKYIQEWILRECYTASYLKPLKSVEALDEHTVKWNFKEPWGSFLGIMANIPGYMISPKALREDPRQCDSHPVGTGPFMFEDRNPGSWFKVKRNPTWWFGRNNGHPDMPYFDGIITTVIPDPSVQLANLKAGLSDMLIVDKPNFDVLKNNPDIRIYPVPRNMVRGYRFNHSKPPFNDIRVRQAVAYAIDRNALVAGVEFGMGRIASCIYPEDHWAHNPSLKPWPYDKQKAKQLLKEAGYANGLTITGFVTTYRMASTAARAEAVKNMLAEVGINWKVDTLDPVAAIERAKSGKDHLIIGDYEGIFDPDLMATSLYHPTGARNLGISKNDAAIALIEKGRREMDPVRRQKIYFELERVLYENCEDIWLFWELGPLAFRKKVMGFDPDQFIKYGRIWDATHPRWFKDGRQ